MHTQNANNQSAFDLNHSPELITNITSALIPLLSAAVHAAVEKAMVLNTSATMSKDDFAAANGISKSVLEKWIANGVVLLAPTPSTTYTQNRKNKKPGQVVETTMTKHGNPLINVAAWREKNRQHALNCRYIKP